mgnify:CR=1 FL=1
MFVQVALGLEAVLDDTGPGLAPVVVAQDAGHAADAEEWAFIELLNAYRGELGLAPVTLNYELGAAAAAKGPQHLKFPGKNEGLVVLGVLATPLTAASGAYRRAVHSLDAGVEVHEQACPEFVPMIECGVVDGPELERVARGYLEPIMERAVDAVAGLEEAEFIGKPAAPLFTAPVRPRAGHAVAPDHAGDLRCV